VNRTRTIKTDVWNIQPFGIKEVLKLGTLHVMDSFLLVRNEWPSIRIGVSEELLLFALFILSW